MVTIPVGDELRRMYSSDTCCPPSASSRSPINRLECQCGSSDPDPVQGLALRWIYYHVSKQTIMMFKCNYPHEYIRAWHTQVLRYALWPHPIHNMLHSPSSTGKRLLDGYVPLIAVICMHPNQCICNKWLQGSTLHVTYIKFTAQYDVGIYG